MECDDRGEAIPSVDVVHLANQSFVLLALAELENCPMIRVKEIQDLLLGFLAFFFAIFLTQLKDLFQDFIAFEHFINLGDRKCLALLS